MKITFAQNDITAALRAHLVSQGINLEGKSVDIKFTMKKGNAGVLADVSIENGVKLPDLSESVRPTLSVVADNTPKAESVFIDPAPLAAEPEVAQATEVEAAPAVKTTSLFN